VSSWVIVLGALVVLVSIRLAVHWAFGAAWASDHLAGRRAGIVLAEITGIVPLAAALWLLVLSGDKLPGALLVAAWMLGYLPVALVLTEYAERYGVPDGGAAASSPTTNLRT
jgi:hypothetical protein